MIWFFERTGQYVRCETRETPDNAYELLITGPDGAERAERFEDSASLAKRQVEIELDLISDGWTGPHGPVV